MRRDSNDKQWKEVKDKVYTRDNNRCRLLKVLNIKEALLLQRNAGPYLSQIDPAHYIAVSENPSIMYDPNNICCLNHYSHSNLDSHKDPIDGHSISQREVDSWWIRILKGNEQQYNYLLSNNLIED